ncbi:Glycosyl transferase family 2 [Planctomycetales bacterium 10988]|nr:Glycosyl transferase family 2 [Planctomycetales bacterium 10988]
MKIHLYTTCWNEIRMLPYFMRHYLPYVDKYVIFDDSSDDGSIEYLQQFPQVEIRTREKADYSLNETLRLIMCECWKESRGEADWVIIVDIDEHLYHPYLLNYLKKCQKEEITFIQTKGYQMISDFFPSPKVYKNRLCEILQIGLPFWGMDKVGIFNPDAVEEINYSVGRHTADPVGSIFRPDQDEVLNLHYKHLGLLYTLQRYRELKGELRQLDIENGWGVHYLHEENKQRQDFYKIAFKATQVPISEPCVNPWQLKQAG